MSIVMRDSVDPSKIPSGTPVVAGYVDGLYRWSPGGWAMFPNAAHMTIAVHADSQAMILDVENGDATPAQVPGWCDRFNIPGRKPTIYCNQSAWPTIKTLVGSRAVDYWIATLDGHKDVPGSVAVQWYDFGGYDESVITDELWIGGSAMPTPQDIARGDIYAVRAALLGDGPGSPDEVAAIEAYVPGYLANVEGGLSALIADCQRDGRYVPKRVYDLEQAIKALQSSPTAVGPMGPVGPGGPQGVAGPAGPQGPPGADSITPTVVTELNNLQTLLSKLKGILP